MLEKQGHFYAAVNKAECALHIGDKVAKTCFDYITSNPDISIYNNIINVNTLVFANILQFM